MVYLHPKKTMITIDNEIQMRVHIIIFIEHHHITHVRVHNETL